MAMALPLVFAAVGAGAQGMAANDAAQYNKGVSEQEAKIADQQSQQQATITRQHGRELLGRSAAAAAQSGTGTGGSTGLVLDQDAISHELDAQNERYKGILTAATYRARGQMQQQEGKTAAVNSGLTAGADLLKAYSAWR